MTQIEKGYIDDMVAHARAELPNECCGILSGKSGRVSKLYRMTNVEASPFRFSMDPREIAEVDMEAGQNGWDLLAIYHSHTRSEAFPSDTDVRLAAGTVGLWPEIRYILVSLMDADAPQVRLFRIADGSITEELLEII
ncbi:MAG: M67 family metallopeptidase [Dehalococcoidia bacterium]|nr:M67 family metallopeptidase [Dehalococcoidia bacterium]MDP6226658.1 M67 family metallopeptidase [Dehalococcoidia bacterium]MDP7084094.1 M67 family metallopeptidase [Dehalococcoidia bacterium]MDP7200831.1 M67 family metallopeptidase [Dehalococcoidia bacterium]MDP7509772.1 M67 family metallopeptidase [Dehalococcoidia bacterium]